MASEIMEKVRQGNGQEILTVEDNLGNNDRSSSGYFDKQRLIELTRTMSAQALGRVLIMPLKANRNADFYFDAPSSMRWSLVAPNGQVLVEDSSEKAWSGKLTEEGSYEFIVTSRANTEEEFSLAVDLAIPVPQGE